MDYLNDFVEQSGGDWWGEHPLFSREDWKAEVANGDTQVGYWEWAYNKSADNEMEEEQCL